uniref:CN hydrolase domain-containing protein n=1 Tax=Stomoxys calcitrans TaxID=35570 RepID=A0A1I8NMJ9_STOCA|nr:unnamed protein product [Stomoxys calcitrans]
MLGNYVYKGQCWGFLIGLLFINNAMVSHVGATADSEYYTAGVVEFRPSISGMTSAELLADHLKAYLQIIESTEAQDTDILVFPEGTLNNPFHLTYVPSEKDQIVPCLANGTDTPYSDFFVTLSCAARRVQKYLVINLTEKENCTTVPLDVRPCASNGLNIYNTNVVFDRDGKVVSRYRKVNVYVENKNTTLEPEYAIFDTDFGVRFGHFICFDILFYTPAEELVTRFGVKDFIFTSLFYSELPFLTATQLQQGWAWGNNVSLLAAGASFPQSGITGTGIYVGDSGSPISVMVKDGIGERRLYKAQVPKNGRKAIKLQNQMENVARSRNLSGLRLMRDPQIENYNSILLDLKNLDNYHQQLCQGDLCCSFHINGDLLSDNTNETYRYRLGVFDGRRSYEKEQYSDIKVCGIYTCAGEDIQSCGVAKDEFQSSFLFKNIQIKGNFAKNQQLLITPSTIDDDLKPLNKEYVQWSCKNEGSSFEVEMDLAKPHNSIMTFAIYGHYYEKSAASNWKAICHCLGISILSYILLTSFHKILMKII